MFRKRDHKQIPELNTTSTADISFMLLIFFLVTSTLINPNALKLLLPKSTGQVSAKPMATVSIKHYPKENRCTYHINGNATPVKFDEIEGQLREELDGEDDPTFSIYADETVPIKEVVAVMNIAKHNHYKVIMATSPE